MNELQIAAANDRRRDIAARRNVIRAREAITVIEGHRPKNAAQVATLNDYLIILQARVHYSAASLDQIAGKLGLRKDQYSARLRRALDFAEAIS